MKRVALLGARIVLPDAVVDGHALLVRGTQIEACVPVADMPDDVERHDLDGGWLLPGFIDTQVNGGGDVLFNDRPDLDGLRTILAAHRRFGTTGMLPTLISDTPAVTGRAIGAVEAGLAEELPGLLGIHIEGPHLNPAKAGIHDRANFVPLTGEAVALLTTPSLGVRVVTVAPELCEPAAIRVLSEAGVIVCAGHSAASYDQALAAIGAGLRGVTHLFNAMTQLGSREPGLVGAVLEDRSLWFGLIVDGLHVHPASLRVALSARGTDRAMLVTDAMPPVGGHQQSFVLTGITIRVIHNSCRGPDGRLAGSMLTMAQASRNAMDLLGLSIGEASRLASGNPADFLRLSAVTGRILPGLRADLVHLDADRRVVRTWVHGQVEEAGEESGELS